MTFPFQDDFDKHVLDNLFKSGADKVTNADQADELILIVDRSGSMQSIRDDAQGGIAAFVEEQKTIGEANLTIIEFDTAVNAVCERVNIKKAQPYELVPRGLTALYDAIGMTLANAESLNPTGKVIVAIVTDGAENSSREYNRQQVFDRISELTEKGWEFLFLSADQDAFDTGANLGISANKTVGFAASSVGATEAYNAINTYTTSLRSGASVAGAEAVLKKYVDDSEELSQQ